MFLLGSDKAQLNLIVMGLDLCAPQGLTISPVHATINMGKVALIFHAQTNPAKVCGHTRGYRAYEFGNTSASRFLNQGA